MTKKNATYLALLFIIVVDIIYFLSINLSGAGLAAPTELGPRYFPNVLSVLLLIFCVISLISTIKSGQKDKFEIPSAKYMVLTTIITVLFIASWSLFDLFYVSVFIFLTALFTIYRKIYGWKKSLYQGAITALFVTAFIYVIFDWLMSVSL